MYINERIQAKKHKQPLKEQGTDKLLVQMLLELFFSF